MATELNLNKPPAPNASKPEDERQERELLNNRRTWMLCCIMDYSTAMQLGKPPNILEDEVRLHLSFPFLPFLPLLSLLRMGGELGGWCVSVGADAYACVFV